MVRHVRPDDRARLAAPLPRRRVVDGLVQAEPSGQAAAGETLQIETRRFRRDHQGQRRRVRRHDQVVAKPALQTQPGNPERAVLVVLVHVDGVVAALRHSPWHPALPAILDLPLHRCAIGLIEQRIFIGRHHQQRHQILEHRAAPRQQDRLAAPGRQQSPQRKPAFLRQRSLGDGDEIAQSRFRGQQIVVAVSQRRSATLYPITSCRRTLSNRKS